jgi:hypothetical protein
MNLEENFIEENIPKDIHNHKIGKSELSKTGKKKKKSS